MTRVCWGTASSIRPRSTRSVATKTIRSVTSPLDSLALLMPEAEEPGG